MQRKACRFSLENDPKGVICMEETLPKHILVLQNNNKFAKCFHLSENWRQCDHIRAKYLFTQQKLSPKSQRNHRFAFHFLLCSAWLLLYSY